MFKKKKKKIFLAANRYFAFFTFYLQGHRKLQVVFPFYLRGKSEQLTL